MQENSDTSYPKITSIPTEVDDTARNESDQQLILSKNNERNKWVCDLLPLNFNCPIFDKFHAQDQSIKSYTKTKPRRFGVLFSF